MTSPSPRPHHVPGPSHLYTAATILGTMLIPHALISMHLQWPVQAFTLHSVIVLLLFGLGLRAEWAERAAAAVPRQRKKPTKKRAAGETLDWLDRSLGDSSER